MAYTFAVSPSDVVTDQYGVAIEGRQLGVWTAQTGGQAVVVTGFDGTDHNGVTVSDAQGRYGFTAPDELGPVLWLDNGMDRWPVVAIETAALATGYVGEVTDAYRAATAAAENAEQASRAAVSGTDANQLADDAEAQVDTLAAQNITLDELYVSAFVPAWTSASGIISPTVPGTGAGLWQTIFIAPFALRLHRVVVSWEYWGVGASNSKYWEFGVSRMHWHGETRDWDSIGASTTQISGPNAGGALQPRTSRTITVDDDVVFSINDLALVGFIPHGSPAQMNYSVAITASWSPV